MNRRQFLTTVSAGGLASSAGCINMGDISVERLSDDEDTAEGATPEEFEFSTNPDGWEDGWPPGTYGGEYLMGNEFAQFHDAAVSESGYAAVKMRFAESENPGEVTEIEGDTIQMYADFEAGRYYGSGSNGVQHYGADDQHHLQREDGSVESSDDRASPERRYLCPIYPHAFMNFAYRRNKQVTDDDRWTYHFRTSGDFQHSEDLPEKYWEEDLFGVDLRGAVLNLDAQGRAVLFDFLFDERVGEGEYISRHIHCEVESYGDASVAENIPDSPEWL